MYRIKQVKSKFLELLEKSTITQAFITMAVVSTACILWAIGEPLPEGLQIIVTIVVGFFFGTKAATMAKGDK